MIWEKTILKKLPLRKKENTGTLAIYFYNDL